MKKLFLATMLLTSMAGAFAQPAEHPGLALGHRIKAKMAPELCDNCGKVQSVKEEKRKGEGGAVGIVGGAVVGGLLGNQIGKGTGNTVATVGGAVAGGFVGNEVQKKVTSKTVWVTSVKLKDGTVKNFEQDAKPTWQAGQVVKVSGNTLVKS
jgi:outer membrane lipoprotein SlyB